MSAATPPRPAPRPQPSATGDSRPSDLRLLLGSQWLWIGLVLLVLGTGPLVFATLWDMAHGDPNPNPVGPGMCAGCTFWPAVAMFLTGLFSGISRLVQRRRIERLLAQRRPPGSAAG